MKLINVLLAGTILATVGHARAEHLPAGVADLSQDSYDADTEQLVNRARWMALLGTVGPWVAAQGLLLYTTSKEGAHQERALDQVAVPAAALAVGSLTWGTSAGYFVAGQSRYGVLSGLGKTALLAAGLGADVLVLGRSETRASGDAMSSEREGGAIPIFTLAAAAGVLAWDVIDFVRLPTVIRESRATTRPTPPVLPYVSPGAGGGTIGLSGQF